LITFSLNTFIKVCLLDTGGRISEVQKRLAKPGGYDFYKPLQGAVRAHSDGDFSQAKTILGAPVNETERKYNQDAFNAFKLRFGSIKSLEAIQQKRHLTFSGAGLRISIDPLFEFTKAGTRQIFCMWPTQKPTLTQKYGAVACHIMRSAYSNDKLGNGAFFFADLVSNKTYSEKQITNNTNLILKADVNSIGTLVKDL
jgi:hypothetical protein